jgi:serine protease Do
VAENVTPQNERNDASENVESLGLSLRDLTPETLQQLGLRENADLQGVLVTEVSQNSEAYRDANLRRGDILTEINRKPVRNERDFLEAYGDIDKGDTFLVRGHRISPNGDTRSFLTALTKPN